MQSEQDTVYKRYNMLRNFLSLVGGSVLWTLFSLLIVPFGAASVALYHTTVKSIIRGEGHFFRVYFSSFRRNFKRSTPIGVAYLLLAAALVFYIRFANALVDTAHVWRVLSYVYTGMLLVLGVIGCFLFATFSHTDEKAIQCIKTGLVLAFQHLFTSITCFLMLLVAGWLILLFPACILILPGACFLVCALVMEPYFIRASGETPADNANESSDELREKKEEKNSIRYPKLP